MSNITTAPSPHGMGRVRLFDDGRFFVECHESQAEGAIKHHLDTYARHFGDVYARQQANDPTLVVAINHLGLLGAYSIGSLNDYPRGFGGQPWAIHFFDGRLEITRSLWFLGDIPADWQDRIVENATLEATR
jgi:hypothetical protein